MPGNADRTAPADQPDQAHVTYMPATLRKALTSPYTPGAAQAKSKVDEAHGYKNLRHAFATSPTRPSTARCAPPTST